MYIIVGATGRIGSLVVKAMQHQNLPVRAVVRDPSKLTLTSVEVGKADLMQTDEVVEAFKGGTTALLITPENPASQDIMGDTRRVVENYRQAIIATGIRRMVALSCIGAHLDDNTGNILMSRMLETALADLDVEKVYIRPSYYFSNWLAYLDTVQQYGILPTFFPEDLKIEMHAPADLAQFITEIMIAKEVQQVYELFGPRAYSSRDIAAAFSNLLQKSIAVQSIPPHQWVETLCSVGFTEDAAKHLADMTQAVVDQKAIPEFPERVIKLKTEFEDYIRPYVANAD